MFRALSEHSTFFREFWNTYHTTGAIAPSGRILCRAITRPLRQRDPNRSVRILEVGAGTGAATKQIVKLVRPGDKLDIVELNDRFVESLNRRFENDPNFRRIAEQSDVLHMPVQDLKDVEPYDFIVSGLPFNNFSPGMVREIIRHLTKLLSHDGVLSFFEYVMIRRMKKLITSRSERQRLSKVGCILKRYLKRYEFKCNTVLVNFPPAYAHHLRIHSNGQA